MRRKPQNPWLMHEEQDGEGSVGPTAGHLSKALGLLAHHGAQIGMTWKCHQGPLNS